MQNNQDLSRVIETIKTRVSLEEIVRECIEGDFVQRGHRLWCCCPLHDEDSPSFTITPQTGLWYCFGACGEGGDLIQFVQRRHQTSFWDSLEWLAARAGVELPNKRKGPKRHDPAFTILAAAEKLYQDRLRGPEGRVALEYLRSRGISEGAIQAFGLGYSPAQGNPLVRLAQGAGDASGQHSGAASGGEGTPANGDSLAAARRGADGLDLWVSAGLVRRADGGRPYDFFRGRLMIPIRDDRGRTVAFGARRLESEDEGAGPSGGLAAKQGPKYINTPETPWFHKGRLIYGYDRASDAVRRAGHLILMEGYTDVICAHQAGVTNAGAVLGTATTEDHARLVRKAGTRRVTLVFDGDEAGRKAAWKALRGLLPLEIDLDVAVPPPGKDPADLVAGGDAAPLMALIEQADPWMDFVIRSLDGLQGRGLSQGIDRILELLAVLPKPVHQEACLMQLAQETDLPLESLRLQRENLPLRRQNQRAQQQAQRQAQRHGGGAYPDAMGIQSGGEQPAHDPATGEWRPSDSDGGPGDESGRAGVAGEGPGGPGAPAQEKPVRPVDPRVKKAYMGVLGAALCDTSLIPNLRPLADSCEIPAAQAVLQAMLLVWDNDDPDAPEVITPQHIVNALGDHGVREHLAGMMAYVEQAEDPQDLLESELSFLRVHAIQLEKQQLLARVRELESRAAYDPQAEAESLRCLARMAELNKHCGTMNDRQAGEPSGV